MLRIIWGLIFSVISIFAYAHEPNQAFFEVFELNKKLVVKAEFPWTIRNILLNTYPALKNATSQVEMETALLVYLRQNLQIVGKKDSLIHLERIEELPKTGHSHGSLYLLVYGDYQAIKKIKNTCMLETYQDQQNFHIVQLLDKTKLEITTTKDNPSFAVESPTLLQHRYIIPSIGLFIFGIILWFAKKRWIKKWWWW